MHLSIKLKQLLLLIYQTNHIVIQLIIVDQLTKYWFIGYLRKKPELLLKVTSFLDITYSWNNGISFGMFQNYFQYSNIVFIIINSIIVLYLWYILLKCKTIASFVGYSFVIGGAISNLIDRFVHGAVFDFIYFHYKNYGLPIFNLADSFISIGVMLLLYDYYKINKSIEKETKNGYNEMQIAIEPEKTRQL